MIEVEKKFQPTEEQLDSLLKDAIFMGEKTNHDVYYDYPDFRMLKSEIRLRNRNNSFELKIKKTTGASQEIEDEGDIKKYFKTNLDLKEFVRENLIPIIDYKTKRKEYRKGEFVIDIDELSFGYKMCEIEILVETENQIKEAEEKILNLAREYNFEFKKILSKRAEYLRLFKPEIYKEIKGREIE